MAGINETKEVLQGIKIIAVAGADIFKDGKIGFDDLSKLSILASSFDDLKAAAQGIDQVDDELKDLSIDEIKELVSEVYGIVKAVKAVLNEQAADAS